jgi:hypothetical protein
MNRTPSGQFVKGCQPGPGRPPRRTEQGYLLATMDACSLADWSEIVASAVESAKAGDSQSRAWLGKLLIGDPGIVAPSPTQVVIAELAGLDMPLLEAARLRAKPELDPLASLLDNSTNVIERVARELAEEEAQRVFLGA